MSWYYGWRPYVPVAVKQRRAEAYAAKLAKKEKRDLCPVKLDGRKIAHSFWGRAWCTNLEGYSDYANRLPRGRTYVRNGSVIDLKIEKGRINATVSGSELYEIRIERNRITGMGLAGIGVVGFFDLSAADEFISVVGLDIRTTGQLGFCQPVDKGVGFHAADFDSCIFQLLGQLTAERDTHPDKIGTCSDELRRLLQRPLDAGVDERGTDPWTPRIAHDVDQLASRRPVRVDAIKCGFGETRRLRLGGCPAV